MYHYTNRLRSVFPVHKNNVSYIIAHLLRNVTSLQVMQRPVSIDRTEELEIIYPVSIDRTQVLIHEKKNFSNRITITKVRRGKGVLLHFWQNTCMNYTVYSLQLGDNILVVDVIM